MKLALAAAGAALAIALPAHATDYSWQVLNESKDGKVTSIITESDDATGVVLSCKSDRLIAGVSTVPGLMQDRITRSTKRKKSRDAVTKIGDEEAHSARWTFLPTTQIAISREGITGKRLFNAAVRGDTVSWQLDGKEASNFTFPEMNDAFKSFAKSCSVTNS